MLNLLRAELIKVRKSKSLKVLICIIAGYALFSCLIYTLVNISSDNVTMDGRYIFASAFSFANNCGIAIPIILIMYICTEFSFGTVRNKIISSNSRTHIYISNLIVSIILGILYVLLNALFSLILAFVFFKYGKGFNGGEVIHILKITVLGILMYITLFSAMTMIAMVIKNTGISILAYFVIVIGLFLLQIFANLDVKILNLIYEISPGGQLDTLMSDKLVGLDIIKSLGINLVFSGIITTVGVVLFNKIDIK